MKNTQQMSHRPCFEQKNWKHNIEFTDVLGDVVMNEFVGEKKYGRTIMAFCNLLQRNNVL